jgi:uncharacterized ferritin-like protein (DUF455 family)
MYTNLNHPFALHDFKDVIAVASSERKHFKLLESHVKMKLVHVVKVFEVLEC